MDCSLYYMLCVRSQSDFAARYMSMLWKETGLTWLGYDRIMAQVFVVVAAGSVIAFIIRDLGDASIAGWIIQVLVPYARETSCDRWLTLDSAGPSLDAKRAFPDCWAPFRCG